MKDVNYNIVQGDSWITSVQYLQSSGSPVILTGASALFEVRDQPGGKILSATASGYAGASATDGIVVTASSGMIDINITPAKTKYFNLPRAAYQLQIIFPGGTKKTLLKGWFIVDPGVIN